MEEPLKEGMVCVGKYVNLILCGRAIEKGHGSRSSGLPVCKSELFFLPASAVKAHLNQAQTWVPGGGGGSIYIYIWIRICMATPQSYISIHVFICVYIYIYSYVCIYV